MNLLKILAVIVFCGITSYLNGQKLSKGENCFKGLVIYEIEVDYIGNVPLVLEEIEGIKRKTFIINAKDSIIVLMENFSDTISIQLSTMNRNLVYDYRTGLTRDYTSIRENNKPIETNRTLKEIEAKEILGFKSYLYEETDVAGHRTQWITKDLLFCFPFDFKTASKLGFPLYEEGLKVESIRTSQITEELSLIVKWQLVDILPTEKSPKFEIPQNHIELFTPLKHD